MRVWQTRRLYYVFDPSFNRYGDLKGEIKRAFDKWSGALAGVLKIEEKRKSSECNVKLIWEAFFDSSIVAWAEGPPQSGRDKMPRLVKFNAGRESEWRSGQLNMYIIALHEIGHVLGLFDNDNRGSIMWRNIYLERSLSDLPDTDVTAVKNLYQAIS